MQKARAVYEAESPEQAKERLATWATTWQEKAPQSVATLKIRRGQSVVSQRNFRTRKIS